MQETPLSFQLGQDPFVWFIGVVESLDDPLKVGRAKVRIFGYHDKNVDALSTDDLPWAYALVPVTQAGSLPNYKYGDWVVGFFLDSRLAQMPIIFGVLPSVPQS